MVRLFVISYASWSSELPCEKYSAPATSVVVPVVFGVGKRYFGSVRAQHLLEDPQVVQGNRVLHLRYRVRR